MQSLESFLSQPFITALKAFFKELNIPINYIADEPAKPKLILGDKFKNDNVVHQLINEVYAVGVVNDAIFEGTTTFESIDQVKDLKKDYDGLLIFGVTLHPRSEGLHITRSQLAEITRAFNRAFPYTPVTIVFKYDNLLSFANSERIPYEQKWREGEKVGKVTILRDIDLQNPHRGHIDILENLNIEKKGRKTIQKFSELYIYWQEVFSVNVLNKKFYQELSNWYLWAVKHVTFPSKPNLEDAYKKNAKLEDLIQEHNATNVIRLLTRLLFTWFIKEKKLIPDELFELDVLQKEILKDIAPYHENGLFVESNKESIYYKAILQNLFFATLNCPINSDSVDKRNRRFRLNNFYGQDRGNDWLYKYENYFKDSEAFLKLMNNCVPFLNGGLFECLDDKTKNLYIDGFSDNMTKGEQLVVPDYLFFGIEEQIDLSAEYGINNNSTQKAAVKGLINILRSYKFTITENTPIEEDVALDPELLGKVFENLLASYNPETKTTARKQTGSFYTPREIVSYMVDESLIAYLKTNVKEWNLEEVELDEQLHQLISYDTFNPFEERENVKKEIIHALDKCKILDPACGSGAFPMGALQKMVHVLQKLDPENRIWKEIQLKKVQEETNEVFLNIEDKTEREDKLKEINNVFDQKINDPDYARKLYLIENCIYGVDIQPIAIQISKLRFFISLVVDQKTTTIPTENFGIRPLPNLETKFVAANTLIGIEKPSAQLSMYNSDIIKTLETELKLTRSKLFGARSKETKLKHRKRDEELRNAIAIELEKSGWGSDVAQKLAGWDPYDQNISSSFFDPEWMFDIEQGFDVVIGNPPYIDSETMVNTGLEDLRKYLSIKLNFTKGNWDIYIAFFEVGFTYLNKLGILTYITPDKWLSKPFGFELRKNLLTNFYIITESGRDVFESVNVDSVITFISKRACKELVINNFINFNVNFITKINKDLLVENFTFDWLFSNNLNLINKFDLNKKRLISLGICESACATSDAYKLKEYIFDLDNTDYKNNFQLKVINTGTIGKYFHKWGKSEMKYLGDKYLTPVVNKLVFLSAFTNSYGSKSIQSKIIIKGLTLLDACFDEEGNVVPGKSTLIFTSKNINNVKFTLGLLNSKLAIFYIKSKYRGSSYNQGITFNKNMINNFPLPNDNFNIYQEIIRTVDTILNKGKLDPNFNTSEQEKQIDELVYELYGLTEEEIRIVEGICS